MPSNVSKWFVDQLKRPNLQVQKFFYIGTSDYSIRVNKYPRIKRTANDIRSVNLNVPLSNVDGALNTFYVDRYTMPNCVQLLFGIPSSKTAGLFAAWGFEEGSGTTAADSVSLLGNDLKFNLQGTLGNSSWIENSPRETGLRFVGANQVAVTDFFDFSYIGSGSSPWTIVLKVTNISSSASQRIFSHNHFPEGDPASFIEGIQFRVSSGPSNELRIQSSGTALTTIISSVDIFDGLPHVLVGMYDGVNAHYIVDSDWKSAVTTPANFFQGGAFTVSATETAIPFIGDLLDARIYNYVPTSSEIYDLVSGEPAYIEKLSVYTGELDGVTYDGELNAVIRAKDKVHELSKRSVGTTAEPVSFGSQIPTDIAWTLVTCYGGLSNITSTSNPDIDYSSFLATAAVFSGDAVLVLAHYEGEKVSTALSALARYNDMRVWVEGDGKLNFNRFSVVTSADAVMKDDIKNLRIDVERKLLINTQYVDFNYSVDSDYWLSRVQDVSTTSVNSFGIQEGIIQEKSVWFADSDSALNIAQRQINLYKHPPRLFTVETPLTTLHYNIADTVRIVDEFFDITSASGWVLSGGTIDMDNGSLTRELEQSLTGLAFILDESTLDGDRLLL